jgi:tetratricopeptide (TPR) repeat protein
MLGNAYANLGREEEAKAAFYKSLELTNNEMNFEGAMLYWLIYFGEFDRVEQRLKITSSTNEFIKAYLHASKGEINKIHPDYLNTAPVLQALNPDKIIKQIFPIMEEDIRHGRLTYGFLMNSRYYALYREDPEFKKLLAYAKSKYESNLAKYGTIEVVN